MLSLTTAANGKVPSQPFFLDVDIRLDLFHAVQWFLKTIPVGASIGKEYGLVSRRPSDLGEKRNEPTADKEKMLKNLAGFELKW